LARAICDGLHGLGVKPRRILEPSAGAGAFVTAAKRTWNMPITAVELQPRFGKELRALTRDVIIRPFEDFNVPSWDLIVGNPPYSLAQAHAEHALGLLAQGGYLAFLLRQSFFGSYKRAVSIWTNTPLRYFWPIGQRPSFIEGANDNSEYGVFVWQKGYAKRPEIIFPPMLWRDTR